MNSHPNEQSDHFVGQKSQADAYLRLAMGLKQFQKQMRGELKSLEGAIQTTQEAQVEPLVERLSRLENLLLLDEGWDRIRERLMRLEQTVEKQNRLIESQQEIIHEQNQQLGECNAVISGLDGKLKDLLPLPEKLQEVQSTLHEHVEPLAEANQPQLPERIRRIEQSLENLTALESRVGELEGLNSLKDQLQELRTEFGNDLQTYESLLPLAKDPDVLKPLYHFREQVIEIVNTNELWDRLVHCEKNQKQLENKTKGTEELRAVVQDLKAGIDGLESHVRNLEPTVQAMDALKSLPEELAKLEDRLRNHEDLFSSLRPLAEKPQVLELLDGFADRVLEIVNTNEIWAHIHQSKELGQTLFSRVESLEKQTEKLESLEALEPLKAQVQQVQEEIKEYSLRFEPLRVLAENVQILEPLYHFSDRVLEVVNTREIWETIQNLEKIRSVVEEHQGAITMLNNVSDRIDRIQSDLDQRLTELGWIEQLRLLPEQLKSIQIDYSKHLEVEHLQSQDIHAGIIPIQQRIDSIAKDSSNWHEAFQKRLEELGGQMDLNGEQLRVLQQLRAELLSDIEELKKVKASARLGRVERSLRQLERLLDVQTVMAFFEKSQRLMLEDKS